MISAIVALAIMSAVLFWRYVVPIDPLLISILGTIRDALLLLFQIAAIVFLLYIVGTIIIWVFRPSEGIVIVSFDVVKFEDEEPDKKPLRKTKRKTRTIKEDESTPAGNDKNILTGKSLSDLLITELVRISRVHQKEPGRPHEARPSRKRFFQRRKRLPPTPILSWDTFQGQSPEATFDPSSSRVSTKLMAITAPGLPDKESGSSGIQFEGLKVDTKGSKALPGRMINMGTKSPLVLTDAGTFGVGGASISISGLLTLFRQLRASRDAEIVISGSLQKFKSSTNLTARLERAGKPLTICEVKVDTENAEGIEYGEKIRRLVRDLAFNICLETWLSSVRSWEWLKYYTEALDAYQRYELNGNEKDLISAGQHCLEASEIPHEYGSVFKSASILADHLYNNGNYEDAEKLYDCAIETYDKMIAELPASDSLSPDLPTPDQIAEIYHGLGLSLLWQEKKAEAENAFHNVLKKNPDHLEAYSNLASILASRGRWDEARETMDKAEKQGLLKDYPLIHLGDFYSKIGLRKEARETYELAAASPSNDGYPNYLLGNLYADEEEFDAAIAQYTRSIELNPDQPLPYIELGFIYYNQDQKDKDKPNYNQDKKDKAKAYYEQANKLPPGYASAHNNLGVIYEDEGDVNRAIAAYERAIDLDKMFTVSYNNLARLYRRQERTDEVIALYKRALKYSPTDPSIHNDLGLIYNDQNWLEDAIEEYKTAINLSPDFASAHNNLGVAYEKQGRIEDAISAYERAIELDQTLLVSYNNLARIYKQQGKVEEAIAENELGIARNPALSFLHTELGFLYEQQGRTDEAQNILTHVINEDPALTDSYSYLGRIHEKKGNIKEALRLNRLAIEKNPQAAFPHYELGRIYDQQGRPHKEAIEEYEKTIALDPFYAAPYEGIGFIYEKQGRFDEAVVKYNRAIELDPRFANSYVYLGRIFSKQGLKNEALGMSEEAVKLEPTNRWVNASLAACYRRLGQTAEYAAQVEVCRRLEVQPYESEYDKAGFEALCGNTEAALGLIPAVLEKKQRAAAFLRRDPDFEFVRSDPRFKILLGARKNQPEKPTPP